MRRNVLVYALSVLLTGQPVIWSSGHPVSLSTHLHTPTAPSHQGRMAPILPSCSPVAPYDSLWNRVDSLANAGLPKSALEITHRIYASAFREKNDPQLVKAIIYRIKLQSTFQENFLVSALSEVQEEIGKSREPVTQILYSILGELYQAYFQVNRFRFRDRLSVAGVPSGNPETWDARRLAYEIILSYRQSLSNETALQEIPIERFRAILEIPDLKSRPVDSSRFVHPTLFDFLAYRALQFFITAVFPFTQPARTFTLNNPAFFDQPAKFVKYPLQPKGIYARPGGGPFIPAGNDTLSFSWYAIRIYQALAQFHFQDKNPESLIDWELQRFSYVWKEGAVPEKDSLYLAALKEFEQNYSDFPASAEIAFALAQALIREGEKYHALDSSTHKYQWELKSALAVCMHAVERFPESMGGKNCSVLIRQILSPSLQVIAEYAVIPGQPALASVSYKTIPALYFRLVQADPEQYPAMLSGLNQEDIFKYLLSLKRISSWWVALPIEGDYQEHRTEVIIPAVQPGFYLLFASTDSAFRNPSLPFSYQAVWSTTISYVTQRNEQGGLDVYLLDRQSGKPLKNLLIEAFSRSYDHRSRQYITTKAGEYRSDESGFFSILPPQTRGNYTNLILHIHAKNDLLITRPLYLYSRPEIPKRAVEQTRFFTDRAIYRPGQPIYFKGIMLEVTGDSTSLKINKSTRVTFTDVNGQKIAEQTFRTDEYGSFNGSFTAPTGVLLGEMRIFNESGSAVVSVEEYKRPTFAVTFDPVEGNYRLREKVTVTGKATGYAGNVIDGGTVSYRVTRMAIFPFREGFRYIPVPLTPSTEIVNGITLTDTGGSFSIEFEAIPDGTISENDLPVFTYLVHADVTDRNGETRSGEQSVLVGYRSLLIGTNIPEKVNLLKTGPFPLFTTNLNGKPTPAEVRVTLCRLHPPDRIFRPRLWDIPDTFLYPKEQFYAQLPHDPYAGEDNPFSWPVTETLFERVMNTGSDTLISLTDTGYGIRDKKSGPPGSRVQDPGCYKLTLTAMDPFGQKVVKTLYFTAFSPASNQVPFPTPNWFVPLTTAGEPGESASFLIGSSGKDIQVIMEIRARDQLQSRQWLKLSNQQRQIDVPILEAYRGNFSVNFLFVRDNRVYQNSQIVTVPYTNKKLEFTFETFRNKLLPGQREEWKIRIANAAGKGVTARLLTTLYDRSLDVFRSHTWSFDLYKKYYFRSLFTVDDGFRISDGSWHAPRLDDAILFRPYDQLNWFGTHLMGYSYFMDFGGKGGRVMMKDTFAAEAESVASGMTEPQPPPQEPVTDTAGQMPGSRERTPENQDISVYPVRKDFRETAFFYPSLISDSTGTLFLKFIVPDALTSWKLLGLAYTPQLDYGLFEKELVTQKELMIFPNVPRFLRQGDTVVFTSRVVNLSDHGITGVAMLDLSEAITRQPLNSLILDTGYERRDSANSNPVSRIPHPVSFTVPPRQSTRVSWTLAIPVSNFLSLLQAKVTAQAGTFRDGEENLIPVLTNRILVTETLPLPVNGKGTFRYHLPGLLDAGFQKSLATYRLTLEFASNPAWYAVQALPALDEITYKSADQIFNAFYSNALASYIAGSNPRIRQVFESWKSLTPDALRSNLEKNEDLKSVLLRETPWILEAESESGSKQKLGLYFDMNNLQNNLEERVRLLRQMQYPSGGWPWFEGMQENRMITLNILTGLGRLRHLGARVTPQDERLSDMVKRAIRYLDGELVNEYRRLQKNFPHKLNDNHLSHFQIHYLYARSFFNEIIDMGSGTGEALDYVIAQSKKYWVQQDLYSQGMIALALFRSGDQTTPVKILQSLSERAIHSPEMGMYWATPAGFQGAQVPVGTQALLMEAYDEIIHDRQAVEEMKVWLLKQKQTQLWQTKQATVDACYALLARGFDLLSSTLGGVTISLGGKEIDPFLISGVGPEAGTGYFRMSWNGEAVKPEMGDVQISKTTDGIAWGGVYWQYFEDLDKITPYETPLSVEKQLFLERNTEAGPVLLPLSSNEARGMRNQFQVSGFKSQVLGHEQRATSNELSIGNKLRVRLIVKVDRNMEFVHLKDLRAAGLEPLPPTPSPEPEGAGDYSHGLSGYRYQDGLGYYQSTTDESTNFFFDFLPKGIWVFEYPLVVNNAGDFSSGIATIQCLYAPEFSAHSEGGRIEVK